MGDVIVDDFLELIGDGGTAQRHRFFAVDEDRGRIVVFSVLDSIGKGGAQAGIENMNLMCNLKRQTGLNRRGLHPH